MYRWLFCQVHRYMRSYDPWNRIRRRFCLLPHLPLPSGCCLRHSCISSHDWCICDSWSCSLKIICQDYSTKNREYFTVVSNEIFSILYLNLDILKIAHLLLSTNTCYSYFSLYCQKNMNKFLHPILATATLYLHHLDY